MPRPYIPFHIRMQARATRSPTTSLPRAEAVRLAIAAARVINALTRTAARDAGPALLHFFGEHAEDFAFLPFDFAALSDLETAFAEGTLTKLAAAIQAARLTSRPAALDRRIDWLREISGLNPLEAGLLAAGVRDKLYDGWSRFREAAAGNGGGHGSGYLRLGSLALQIGCSEGRLRDLVVRGGRLARSGLIEDHHDDDYRVSPLLVRIMRMRAANPAAIEAALLKPAPASTLEWDDFAHLPSRDLASGLVTAAIARKQGLNILFHGAPGTGKTEFSRALADRLGLAALFIGEADDNGEEPSRHERLAHLSMARSLTRAGDARLLVIDEADDLMFAAFGDDRQRNSKLWLNQLVESSATPTVWIVNDARVLGAPVVRRMGLALGFDLPPARIRQRVAERHAAHLGLTLGPADAARLGALPVPPAVTASALGVASLAGGGIETALAAAQSLSRAMGGEPRPALLSDLPFDPALSRADNGSDDGPDAEENLAALSQRLSASPERRWSLLLSGPSGTGKSAYARHLAAACGLEVVEKRASDLLDMYVGGTEKAIAAAFREAVEVGGMLILDEADSLLRDRRGADHGWEVSSVNEMLRGLEAHPLPFVITTNLAGALDPATARRFLFKLRFRPLDAPRAATLFTRTFSVPAPPALADIEDLVPSDFGLVARRAALLTITDPATLLAMLTQEVETRREGFGKSVGFSIGPRLRAIDPQPS